MSTNPYATRHPVQSLDDRAGASISKPRTTEPKPTATPDPVFLAETPAAEGAASRIVRTRRRRRRGAAPRLAPRATFPRLLGRPGLPGLSNAKSPRNSSTPSSANGLAAIAIDFREPGRIPLTNKRGEWPNLVEALPAPDTLPIAAIRPTASKPERDGRPRRTTRASPRSRSPSRSWSRTEDAPPDRDDDDPVRRPPRAPPESPSNIPPSGRNAKFTPSTAAAPNAASVTNPAPAPAPTNALHHNVAPDSALRRPAADTSIPHAPSAANPIPISSGVQTPFQVSSRIRANPAKIAPPSAPSALPRNPERRPRH